MKTVDFLVDGRTRFRAWGLGLLLCSGLLVGCGGVDICKCLEEADKVNPEKGVMEECRLAFSNMEMDEVKKAVEECGR